jgi:hypothetical protein
MSDECYYDSNHLNHVIFLFDKQDTMIQIFESCYIPV